LIYLTWIGAYVKLNPDLLRPTDIKISLADPSKAQQKLGWKAGYAMKEVAAMMVEAYMADMMKTTSRPLLLDHLFLFSRKWVILKVA
jgi:UDP-glucose 4-epimerase